MVPWPIALLTLFYGGVAALSAATLWKGALGWTHQSAVWAAIWLACSGAAAVGLAWLRPWGRHLAMGTSWLLIASTLAIAGLLVAGGHPAAGLLVTFSTACHYLMIRYLKRPTVMRWFGETGAPSSQQPAPSE